MARNLPLGFGLFLTAAVLFEKGAQGFGLSFGTSAPTTGTGTSPSSGTISKKSGLNTNQSAFASRLATDTGLDPNVVAAWLISEEPASAKAAPNGANNWLNIGAFSGGNWAGANTPAWKDPITAADATAHWLAGRDLGFGKAAAGIQAILRTAGRAPADQIRAIQASPWAGSHYPNLMSTYQSIVAKVKKKG